jgi:hypothetical protein
MTDFYIKLATLEYPRHIGDIWIEHPELEGKFECPETYAPVYNGDIPEFDSNIEYLIEETPNLINETWYKNWVVVKYTQEELDDIAKRQAEIEAGRNQE